MRSNRLRVMDAAVAFSLVVLTFGLAAPAVLHARATARAASCSDNFKVLGLALHNYHDAWGLFPPGRVWEPDATRPAHDNPTALLITPFLEQAAVYNTFNFHRGSWVDVANKTTRQQKLDVFLCPDDLQRTATENTHPTGQPTNVAMSLGSLAWSTHPAAGKGPKPEGVFFDNSSVALRDILDGTAVTVFASEQLIDRPRLAGSAEQTGACSGDPVEGNQFDQRSGTRWITGHPSSAYFNARRRPNDAAGDCFHGNTPRGIGYLNKVPRSHHAGGVYTLFGDGSVQFIRDGVDLDVWQRLNTRAGQEIVDVGKL